MSVTVTEPTIAERVDMLRMLMTARGVDVYVIPSPDPHQNEYVPDIWQRRTWISGFDGSAGTAVVTANKAYVWTDSRYWLQADRQLADTPFEVMRQGQPDVPSPEDWLESNLMDGSAVGLDPQIFTLKSWRSWEEKIQRGGSRIVELEGNLVDEIWKARPQFPKEPLLALSTEFSGKSVEDKLADLRKDLARARCNAHILTKLDSIAWLFNIRGNDVEHNPLPLSYAIVTGSDAQLFIDPDKVTPEVKEHFGTTVTVRSYGEFGMELEALNQKLAKVWVDPATVSRWIVNRLTDDSAGAGGGAAIYERESPVVLAKALKNDVELEGMRRCHVRDGAAVCKFLRWLDETIAAGKTPDEIEVADQLESYRKQGEHFKGLSFRTISGYGPNGAVVHYTVTPDTALRLEQGSLYLVDSGGQYLDGTTDITRTVPLGEPTDEQKDRFTRVLKGHIAIATARFPDGTRGGQIDVLARQPLWEIGLNYGHGTGHGVGHFLCVHEGPQGIAPRSDRAKLEPGMILSNEPGYYKDGEWGIRIENLVEVVEREPGPDGTRFFGFADLTMAPIDTRLVDRSLLTDAEVQWLNDYHAKVREQVEPLLQFTEDKEWLATRTAAI